MADCRRTAPSSSGLGRRPLTAVARVRIPSGLHRARAPDLPVGGSRRSGPRRPDAGPASLGSSRSVTGVGGRSRDPHEPSAGRRPGDPLLRRRPAPRASTPRGHPRPAAGRARAPSCATTRCSASGWHRLAPADPHLPAAGRPVPAVPVAARTGRPRSPTADYQVVVFENRFPSLATGVDQDVPPTAPGAPLAELRPGFGRCEVVVLHRRPRRGSSPSSGPSGRAWSSTSGPSGRRSWARIDGVEQVFSFENHGEEIGVTLSHPHGQIYAYPYVTPRAEKILASVAPPPGGDRRRPVRRGRRGRARRAPGGRRQRALDRVRARPPRAGPTRCSSSRPGGCPTCPRSTTPSGTPSSSVYLDVLGRFARRWTPRCPTSRPGTRRRCAPGARTGGCTCSCSRSGARPGKLKYLAGSESGMGAFITDTNPEDVAEQLRAVVVA